MIPMPFSVSLGLQTTQSGQSGSPVAFGGFAVGKSTVGGTSQTANPTSSADGTNVPVAATTSLNPLQALGAGGGNPTIEGILGGVGQGLGVGLNGSQVQNPFLKTALNNPGTISTPTDPAAIGGGFAPGPIAIVAVLAIAAAGAFFMFKG